MGRVVQMEFTAEANASHKEAEQWAPDRRSLPVYTCRVSEAVIICRNQSQAFLPRCVTVGGIVVDRSVIMPAV